jgi:hypothetical protein
MQAVLHGDGHLALSHCCLMLLQLLLLQLLLLQLLLVQISRAAGTELTELR